MSSDINIIYDMAKKAQKAAEHSGADEVEVFGLMASSVNVDIQLDRIDLAKESFSKGIGVKAIVNGAVGFSSTNDPARIVDAAKAATSSARVRRGDPDWTGLPQACEYRAVTGIHDPRIANIDIETCIDLSMKMIDGAVSLDDARPTSGKFTCLGSDYVILNSSGVEVREASTRIDGFIECRAGDGNEISTAYEFDISRNLDIDFFHIGSEAARQALEGVGSVGVDTCRTDVLLKPSAIADILESTFLNSLNSENIQKGRSALAGKLGEKIGANGLDIVDDGLLEGGIGSARSDDEGTPSRINRIMENGVLGTYLYDKYTAGKDGVESTGSAVRNNYAQTTSIDARNLKIEYPASDIIAETQKGVLVGSVIGAHTANPISGDFSVEARNSFLVEDGDIGSPIRSMMVTGNVFELLHNISGAGRDTRVLGNIITPTVKVSGLKIVG
ncbi:MAG: PmbA protein [Candidatus Methanocomedens sp.]|nr:MAG: PmbA protein [ANME-2 cluster archaeon]